jgi:hypothetical protein
MIFAIYFAAMFVVIAFTCTKVWWIYVLSIVLSSTLVCVADSKYNQLKERIRELERIADKTEKGGDFDA